MTGSRRGVKATLAIGVALGAQALTLPQAGAGGPGVVYIYGDTYSQCAARLSGATRAERADGREVTGAHSCRKTGNGQRYFGDYVAN